MSDDEDWKQRALQHDMARFGAAAKRAGAVERRHSDDEGRVRLVEHYGRQRVVRTYLGEDGTILRVSVSSNRQEMRVINRQWDELAASFSPELLSRLLSRLESHEGQQQHTTVLMALEHIWRRRPDLRSMIEKVAPVVRVTAERRRR